MKKSKATIDDLAGMVQKGFSEVNEKFDKVFDWQRLTDGRLDAIEIELIDIKKKLANVIDRREFELLKERVENLENRLASIKRK